MKTTLLAFGIAREMIRSPEITLELQEGTNVKVLKDQLEARYPALKTLHSYLIAINDEYAEDDSLLNPGDEIAIIPPVSGG